MEHWYAVQTKPGREHQVAAHLAGRGIAAYLPVLPAATRGPRRRSALGEPFFARYLFPRLDLGVVPLSSVNWAPGVASLLAFGGEPAVVPDAVIVCLQERLARAGAWELQHGEPLQQGDLCRIVAGPLQGLGAVFDRRLSAEGRARILVGLLGNWTACEIDLECLERR